MPLFEYSARGERGRRIEGRIEAGNAAAAALRLETTGIVPIEIREAQERGLTIRDLLQQAGVGRPSSTELVMFTRQMYTIAKAGLPWLRGLRSLQITTRNPALRRALGESIESLETGRELSASLGKHAALFPPVYVSMVAVGEETGTLETIFRRLAEHLQSQHELRHRVRSALRYPLIVLATLALAVAVLVSFVIPKFAPIFRQLGDDIPLPTELLLGTAAFFQAHGTAIVVEAIALRVLLALAMRRPDLRLVRDRLRLRVPVFGRLQLESTLARSLGTLSLTLGAGIPMIRALELIEGATDNAYVATRFAAMRSQLETGEPLSRAAAQADIFPPLLLQMLEIGEETGELPRLLDEAADHYRREVDHALSRLNAAIEPALMIVIGGLVLLLALGIFLPLWDMVGKAVAR